MRPFILPPSKQLVPLLALLLMVSFSGLAQNSRETYLARGTLAFQAGDFPAATDFFLAAHTNDPAATDLLFKLGLAESQIPGRELRAICWFEAYLAAVPLAPNAAMIQRQVQALDAKSKGNLARLLQAVQGSTANLKDEQALYRVVLLLGDLGDSTGIKNLADRMTAPNWKAATENALAEAETAAGNLNGAAGALNIAQKYVGLITQNQDARDYLQSATYSDRGNLVKAQAKAGDLAGALKNAELLPDLGTNKLWRSNAYHTVAEALAARGNYNRAWSIAGQIPDHDWRTRTITDILDAQARGGDPRGALRRVESLPEKDGDWSLLATLQAGAGDLDGARHTASLIQDSDTKCFALAGIAGTLMQRGEVTAAMAIFDTLNYSGGKDFIIGYAAEVQADATNFATALQLVGLESDKKSFEYRYIARHQANSGDIAGALQTAGFNRDAEPDQFWRSGTLYDIANAQAQAGDLIGAQKTVDQIENQVWRDSAQTILNQAVAAVRPDWLANLGDHAPANCGLNTEVFLNLAGYLGEVPASNDPQNVLDPVISAAETMHSAQTNIDSQLAQAAKSRAVIATYLTQGNQAYSQGDFPRAITNYTRILQLLPSYVYAYNNRGLAEQAQGDADAATADYLSALDLAPNDADVCFNLGFIKRQKGDYPGAVVYLTRALRINPQYPNAWFYRGYARQQSGDLDGAVQDYTVAIYANPKDFNAYNNRGSVLHAQGYWEGSIKDYQQAVALNPTFPNPYLGLSRVKYDQAAWDEAITDASKALELNPNYAGAYTTRGNARHQKTDLDGALDDYTKAIALGTNDLADLAQAWNNLATIKAVRGDWDAAIAGFSQAIAADPAYVNPYFGRGNARQVKGDLDGARADYQRALAVQPDYAPARQALDGIGQQGR
jgi:tetratricopeptide (TPR) repeat protein